MIAFLVDFSKSSVGIREGQGQGHAGEEEEDERRSDREAHFLSQGKSGLILGRGGDRRNQDEDEKR